MISAGIIVNEPIGLMKDKKWLWKEFLIIFLDVKHHIAND